MGRTGIAPRPSLRSRTGRAFAVVLASLALLLCGTVEVLPRSAAAASPSTSATTAGTGSTGSTTSRSLRAGSLEAPGSSLSARAAALAGVPAPSGPGSGLAPAPGPRVAPHLVAVPQSRPPTSPLVTSAKGAPGSRAPPGPAGT